MYTTKTPQKLVDPLARTYTDDEIKKLVEKAPGEVRRLLTFVREERSKSCLFMEAKKLIISHGVNEQKAAELITYMLEKKLIYLHITEKGSMLSLTDNATEFLTRLSGGVSKR
ncbi:MAG TPA: hypothetical protein VMV00_02010 [Candidatus Baltobacteraceae bacterium]|nr:hypothetical protein [Candidatus Baltobacteraceae bacterium]